MHIDLEQRNHQGNEHAESGSSNAACTILVAIHTGFPVVRDLKNTCAIADLPFPSHQERQLSSRLWYELSPGEGQFVFRGTESFLVLQKKVAKGELTIFSICGKRRYRQTEYRELNWQGVVWILGNLL